SPALCLSTSLAFLCTHTPPSPPYTLSLHDALPISPLGVRAGAVRALPAGAPRREYPDAAGGRLRLSCDPCRALVWLVMKHLLLRSEEHTSELQSQSNLVCRLLLEKKKKNQSKHTRV